MWFLVSLLVCLCVLFLVLVLVPDVICVFVFWGGRLCWFVLLIVCMFGCVVLLCVAVCYVVLMCDGLSLVRLPVLLLGLMCCVVGCCVSLFV